MSFRWKLPWKEKVQAQSRVLTIEYDEQDGVFIQRIRPRDFLGIRGAQGKFKAKYDENGQVIARKTVKCAPHSNEMKYAERECTILKSLNHQNIVGYKSSTTVYRTPILCKIKLSMDYCEHGSLKELIARRAPKLEYVEEDYVWNIITQIASALEYCHFPLVQDQASGMDVEQKLERGPVIHRDIKPGNILLASASETALDAVKLADFGLSITTLPDAEPTSYLGTRVYTPPVSGMRPI